ncbi:hypothetical protein G6030_07615 [Dietzia sp. E1]|uniref:hypothetical protein n=1 Tax=Dietzia sp. E1 TaxID=328361 RepID=UPI0015F9844B|nr:hypothetical protein [Dietzia sp. E1]MBB1021148.1 hypothetical protein [Dietzia sp. E1]
MTNVGAPGLTRADIEHILKADADMISVERIGDAPALWRVTYSIDGRPPIEMMIDNGINQIYVQVLIQIDADHIFEALSALGPYATVGLAVLSDMLFIRSAFYIEFSTMHAFTNSYHAAALAYLHYLDTIAQ